MLRPQVSDAAEKWLGVEWLGRQPMEQVYALMQSAQFLIFPSKWYEGLPRTLIEAFACGTPVIASNVGTMSSFITPYETGLHFQPGNADDLVTQVEWAISNPQKLAQMRQNARSEFEKRYTSAESYQVLINIYHQSIVKAG